MGGVSWLKAISIVINEIGKYAIRENGKYAIRENIPLCFEETKLKGASWQDCSHIIYHP